MNDEERPTERFKKILGRIYERTRMIREQLPQLWQDPLALMRLLNPDVNRTVDDYYELKMVLKQIHRGEIMPVWLTEWHSESMRLIEDLIRYFPSIISFNHCYSAQCGLYRILSSGEQTESEEKFQEEIEHKLNTLKKAYRANSDGLQMIAAQSMSLPRVTSRRKRSSNWKRKDAALQQSRKNTRQVLQEINRRWLASFKNGRAMRSRLSIVQEMMNDGAHCVSMAGKRAETWANQASRRRA